MFNFLSGKYYFLRVKNVVTGLIVSRFFRYNTTVFFYIVPQEEKQVRVGLDIGSTIRVRAVLDEHDARFIQHTSVITAHIWKKAQELLRRTTQQLHGRKSRTSISAHAAWPTAACLSCRSFHPRGGQKARSCDGLRHRELGGIKILFLTKRTEVRMNGSCAGGTGAYHCDGDAALKMSADEMNKAAEQATPYIHHCIPLRRFSPRATRAALINQGRKRPEDIAASTWLPWSTRPSPVWHRAAPSRVISSIWRLAYLSAPRQESFDEALNVTGTCPENSLLYVALGAALYADKGVQPF